MVIETWDSTTEGTLSEGTLRAKLQGLGYVVTRYRYPPGTQFPPHTHDVEKMDAVLSGRFKLTLGGESVILGPGDAIVIPAGAEHSAEVVGDQPVVSLDGVKTAFREL
jgi:quercetin dioxygenase-like cupin family protein